MKIHKKRVLHIYSPTHQPNPKQAMATIINVHPDWIKARTHKKPHFPQLHYYTVECSELPCHHSNNNSSNTLVCGGSYNIYVDTPLFEERCLILEDLYFPYDINSKYIKVRHGALLWPRINLDAYTYLPDPQRVFLKKHNKFIAEFRFYTDRIELYECIL